MSKQTANKQRSTAERITEAERVLDALKAETDACFGHAHQEPGKAVTIRGKG